ncbi:MAG: TolC family protein, partial [Usitatibacter sp.]
MKRPDLRRLALAGALAAALSGCALAPAPTADEVRTQGMPNARVPAQWSAGGAGGIVADGWLASFHDADLERLVAEAMAYNSDLQIAAARVEAAEANARAAGAALYPQVNLSGRGGTKLGGDASGISSLGLFAAWEIDLWGRVRSVRASGSAQYESAALDARYARESIAALVAKSWFLAEEASVQRAIAEDMVSSSDSLADLTRDRVRVGKGDDLEVAQAEASALSYRDLMLQADIARSNALRAIEILAGRYPSAGAPVGQRLAPIPPAIPAGLPSELLERRPDVRAAERRVAAAFYRVEEA